jgi:uncharacterized pyridoxal phosphate-containing UPF0001 family protein
VEKEASKIERKIDVLLQFHIADEESKHGFTWDEAVAFLNSELFQTTQNVSIVGVMGMATFTENQVQISNEFTTLKKYFDQLKNDFFKDSTNFHTISMGMSGDYSIATDCGSTMIRVGSAIFGER